MTPRAQQRRAAFDAAFPLPLDVRMTPKWESEASSQHATLLAPFTYESAEFGAITVPAGFETDFASVPFAARWYVDSTDPDILFPSIIHDWLYQNRGEIPGLAQALTREQADGVLREAMRAIGSPTLKTTFAYRAVRLGGWHAWRT